MLLDERWFFFHGAKRTNHTLLRSWSTHWFKLQFDIPSSWLGEEVHLLWNSGTEALVWVNGEPLQVNPFFTGGGQVVLLLYT